VKKEERVNQKKEKVNQQERRDFIKQSAAIGGALALGGLTFQAATEPAMAAEPRFTADGKSHVLGANPSTATAGYWDNSTKPAMTINSGDIVFVETRTHLMGKMIPDATIQDWEHWYKELIARTPNCYFYPDKYTGAKKIRKGAGHHTLTGPIYVNGAEPGDILQIEILQMDPIEYAFNLNPTTSFMKLGLLAADYPNGKVRWYRVQKTPKGMKFVFQPGIELPVNCFPGTLGVELPEPGMWSNVPPGKHGGNMDNKNMVAGSVVYLPVWVKGAGLKTGDSHFAQGHGEVDLNALEGAFRNITMRITVRKDLKKLVDWPFASTPTNWIAMGFHTDLLESCKMAVRKAVNFLHNYYGLPKEEAYALCSMGVDLHVTQLVDYTKGIHAMIPKSYFVGAKYAKKNGLLLAS